MFLWRHLTAFLLITISKAFPAEKCEKFSDLSLAHSIIGTNVKVRLLLYTRQNDSCATLLSHSHPETSPHFILSRPTTFIIHGFRFSGSPPVWLDELTKLLLEREDINVVVVDWNYGAANLNYLKAVDNTHIVAKNITAFITTMWDRGASLSSIYLIGVSLGAHISGFVGAKLNGTIGRITALDAAGPAFTGKPRDNRLDSTDAQFVDVIHTDIDALGYKEPLGHIDYYVNGGSDQPGCPRIIFAGTSFLKCDHQRSVMLYTDSLKNTPPPLAYPCSSHKDFLDGRCLNCDRFGEAGCPVFGYDVIQWKDSLLQQNQTKYFITTNKNPPYWKTNYRVDMMTWNQNIHEGYLNIKLYNATDEAVATVDHKSFAFEQYKEAMLFAQFDKDIHSVNKVSLKFSTSKACQAPKKLRVLRFRLTNLKGKERSLCRYDLVLQNKEEFNFRPIPCHET